MHYFKNIHLALLTLALSFSNAYGMSLYEKIGLLRFGNEIKVNAEKGIVDLENLKDDAYYHVHGEALFFPGEYLEPKFLNSSQFKDLIDNKKPLTAKLKNKSYPYPFTKTDQFKGTFLLKFKNVPSRLLALHIVRKFHPFSLFIAQEELTLNLQKRGDLNADRKSIENLPGTYSHSPAFEAKGDFYIYVHANSPEKFGKNTLNLSTFYLGSQDYLVSQLLQSRYFSSAISGGFIILTIFYSFIFLFRPKDFSSLYISGYAFSSSILSIIYAWDLGISIQKLLDTFTIVNLTGITFLQHYLVEKLKPRISSKLEIQMKTTFKSLLVIAAIAVYFQFWSVSGLLFLLGFITSFVLIGINIYLGFKYSLEGLVFFCVGVVLNAIFQFPVFLSYTGLTDDEIGFYILIASFVMALALALVNAREFASTYLKSVLLGKDLEKKNIEITNFNKNLEKMVTDKTKEVRALLDYIPQGVLSIGTSGAVAKDYSAHLVNILSTSEIGDQSFRELVLENCQISEDEKDQAWQSINAMVGQSEFSFDANEDKLPRELILRKNGEEKHLKTTWDYLLDDQGDIERLLVTFLDISQEKQLEKEAANQKREMRKIEELINVSPSKAAQFFSTSLPLLNEIKSTVGEQKEFDPHTLRTLFVNAHTVKGASRTLHLKELTEVLHEMENYYSHCLKNEESPDKDKLFIGIHQSMVIYNEYLEVNHKKLNRSSDFAKVPVERDFIENHYELRRTG